ncbi:MAG: O-antigen ligase family protein [Flavobacteriales bacterium]|nr:O-antigen ligase family protein [Flavobacteriales bacterium]
MLKLDLSNRLLYISSAAYILLTGLSLYFEFYYITLLPAVIAVLWMAFFKLEYILWIVAAFTPVSINIEEFDMGGIGMYIPTEPLLFGVLIVFIFKLLSSNSIDSRIFCHTISYIIYAYLGWMVFTSITSEHPFVSVKYVLTRMWFIASFYFLAVYLFSRWENIRPYFLLYLFPLFGVIIYTVVRHSQYGFDKESSHWVMEPLFKDHTSYGAVLAMYYPILTALLLSKKMQLVLKVLLGIGFLVLTAGLILSYTRAAWLSVIAAAIVLVAMILRIKFRTIILTSLVLASFLYVAMDDIQIALQRNKQESSDKLEEHVGSISNVSSDASNLERLNRWNCAIEMWKERPVLGWGPGVYQFEYAPFQKAKDRTIISTNEGDGGNAHSEYLGPLCEQGVLGMALVILLVLSVCAMGFRLFFTVKDFETKLVSTSAFLGLITYFVHGVLNNYLDTDKASIPFWGFIAVLVAVDLYHTKVISHRSDKTESKI